MSERVKVSQIEHAVQQVYEWLDDLAERPPFEDRRQAYSFLRAVLHAVRDRLTVEEVAHLGSQFPMIVQGMYFEGWRPALAPNDFDTPDELYDHVCSSLAGGTKPGLDVPAATRAVLELLAERVDPGALRHVLAQLPEPIAALFPAAATRH